MMTVCVGIAAAETAAEPTAPVAPVTEPDAAGAFDLTELAVAVLCFVLGLLTTIVTGVVRKNFNKNKLTKQYDELWALIGQKLEQAGLKVDRAAIEAALKQMSAAALKELAKAFNNDEQAE